MPSRKETVKSQINEIEIKIGELEMRRKELLSELGESSLSWGMVVAGAFGALLVGLGVIALFAANWDAFGREARVGIALLPFAVCGVTAIWAYAKRVATRLLWEPLGIFWCLSVTAAVCLVAQTCHIDFSVPGEILLVALLMLPVIWVTRSAVPTVLWPVTAIAWAISKYHAGVEASIDSALASLALMALSVPAYVIYIRSRPRESALVSVHVAMGLVYSVGLGILLSMSLPLHLSDGTAIIYIFWLCAACVAGAGHVFSLPGWGSAGAVIAIGFTLPTPFMQSVGTYAVAIAIAIGTIVYGVRTLNLGFANSGAVTLLWLVLLKFFTSSVPFVLKGTVLITAGVALTVLNIALVRHRKAKQA